MLKFEQRANLIAKLHQSCDLAFRGSTRGRKRTSDGGFDENPQEVKTHQDDEDGVHA